jgi:O-antigen/teichoic acid export membrane protein
LLVLFAGEITNAINVSSELRGELLIAIVIGAVIVPVVIVNAGFLGILEAINRFEHSNTCRVLVATLAIGGATLISVWSQRIWIGMLSLGIARLLVTYLAMRWLRQNGLQIAATGLVSSSGMLEFLKSARWITTSNVLGVGLAYGDRLILLFVLSAATLAWYVVPYEIVTKLLVIATAVGNAVFPAFSSSAKDHAAGRRLFWKAMRLIALALVPIAVGCAILAKPALEMWISSDFATHSASVAQILCLGVVFNAFATVPFAYLQAVGRARAVAYIHILETPLYVAALLWAAHHGVQGIAGIWSARMFIDLLLLATVATMTFRSRQIIPAI